MGRQQASKIYKTKRFTKEADQILNDDMKSKASLDLLEHQKFDEYLPGLGQHYCVPCAKYYESDIALKGHKKSKVHKRQLKNIKFGPYSTEEAASGAGRDVEKFLKHQTKQAQLLKSEAASTSLNAEKGTSHKKQQRRREVAEDMDIEAAGIEAEQQAQGSNNDTPAVEEISV